MPVVLVLPLMLAAVNPVVSQGFEADEYPVLDAVLARHRHVDGSRPVLLSSTPPGSSASLAGRAEDEVGNLESATVDSFVAREALGVSVSGQRLGAGVRLLSREEKRRLWPDADCEAGWKRFRERFPKASGLFETTRVGLNHDRTQALVAFSQQSSCDAGGVVVYVLEKAEGQWHVVAVVPVEEDAAVKLTPLTHARSRDPAWVTARAKAGEARRQREAARGRSEWLGRCARVIAHQAASGEDYALTRVARMKALDAEGFTQEDERACNEIRGYFQRRDRAVMALISAALGEAGSEADDVARFESVLHRLGPARVLTLERHAQLFTPSLGWGLPLRLSGAGESLATEVRASLNAAVRLMTNETFLEKYLALVSMQETDPRSFTRPVPPIFNGSFLMAQFNRVSFEESARRRVRQSAVEAEARQRAGLSAAEVSLFERLLEFHGRVLPRRDDEKGQKTLAKMLEDHRAVFEPDVAAWFESQAGAVRARVEAAKRDARLARWWPWPTSSLQAKGPSLLVHGAHAETHDGRAPFSLRLLDADGKTRWRCEDIVVVEGTLEAPCLRADGVFGKPGRHRFVLDAKGRGREFPVVVDGKELVVEVEVDGPGHRLTPLRVLPAPAGVALSARVEGKGEFHAKLVNGTSLELWPHDSDWKKATRLDHDDARGWASTSASPASSSSSALAPGATTELVFAPRGLLRYQAVARVAVRLRTHQLAEGAVYEARSNALPVGLSGPRRETGARPDCVEEPTPPGASPLKQLLQIKVAASGTWLLGGTSVSRLEGDRARPVWSTNAFLYSLQELKDGRLLVQSDQSVFVSGANGMFQTLQIGLEEPRLVVETGDDLLVTSRDGRALRISPNGVSTKIALPELATWKGGAFDGGTGVLVSACHTLAVTKDGGRSWVSRPAPSTGSVVLRKGALFLAGRDGLFKSTDLGVTFEKVVDRPCRGISARGARITVACDVDPDTRSGVLIADSGGPFVPVPSLPSVGMRSVAAGEGDELFALTGNGLLLRGSSKGLQPVLLEDEDRSRLLNIVTPSMAWVELDEHGRPRF